MPKNEDELKDEGDELKGEDDLIAVNQH